MAIPVGFEAFFPRGAFAADEINAAMVERENAPSVPAISRGVPASPSMSALSSDGALVYPGTVSFLPADRVLVDESKARGYYVVATASVVGSVHALEKALRRLLKPGSRRIHFKSESDSRRREILSRPCELDVRRVEPVVQGRVTRL